MSVEALLQEPDFPFVRFLDDRGQYARSCQFWQTSFEEGLNEKGDRREWTVWMNNPLADGIPIWSVINRRLGRGISVQQVERSDDPVWLKCWVGETAVEVEGNIPYLFVETFVSGASQQAFARLVRDWTDEDISVADLAKLADQMQIEACSRFPHLT